MKFNKDSIPTLLLFLFLLWLSTSCVSKHNAASSEGFITDTFGDQYVDILFTPLKGKADYSYLLQFYFPYNVVKKDEVVLVPKKYLDSLHSVNREFIR